MFLLTAIYRTMSSGFESKTQTLFNTIEEASEYIRTEWYDNLCELNYYPSEWNEDALGPMPSRDDFTVEAIKKIRGSVLFAPYDKEICIIQNELHLRNIAPPKSK